MSPSLQARDCSVCGRLSDDGGWVAFGGGRRYVCRDCLESVCEEPKWSVGDRVRFSVEIGDREGEVEVVDRGGAWGVFGHSYDIMGTDGVLYKHIPQRDVTG